MKILDMLAQGNPSLKVISNQALVSPARNTIAHGLTINGHAQTPQIVIPIVRAAANDDTLQAAVTVVVDWAATTSTNVVLKASAACTVDIYVG